jgi:hypothetical protein
MTDSTTESCREPRRDLARQARDRAGTASAE